MKRILLSLIVAFALTTSAKNKIELSSMSKYHEFKSEVKSARKKAAPIGNKEKRVGVVLEMNDGYTVGQLADKVSRIGFDRGRFGKVYVTLEQLEALNTMPEVKHIAFEPTLKKRLDTVVPEMKVDNIHQGGGGLQHAFTGEGVAVVVYDRGFDPNHPMFLNEDGVSRVVAIVTQSNDEGYYDLITDEDEIRNYTTDDEKESHATHVTGIAAGQFVDNYINLVGIAPGASIVYIPQDQVPFADMADIVGRLHDEWNVPIVVNISLGDNEGLHSDKGTIPKLLDEVAMKDNVIFCIAAGNEGGRKIVQRKTFGDSSEEMKSIVLVSLDENATSFEDGNVFFEGKGPTPFKVTPVIYDAANDMILKELKGTLGTTEDETVEDEATYDIDEDVELKISTMLSSAINPETGNFETTLCFAYDSNEPLDNTLLIGYIVTMVDDEYDEYTTVTAYVNDTYALGGMGDESWKKDITFDGTINTLACGKNTIAVGAYITRLITEPTTGFDAVLEPDELGNIINFSSWGTLYDGRSFPHIVTPGVNVLSSINSYNTDESNPDNSVCKVNMNGRDYYFAGYSGTSMATPAMTGVVALWLEANPDLTFDKARSIAMETAVKDEHVLNAADPVKYGAGKVDALAGLKKVLADVPTSIKDKNARTGKNILIDVKGDRTVNVFAANENELKTIVYTADGRTINKYSVKGDTIDINLPAAGLYIVKVIGEKSTAMKKVVVE